MPFNKMTKNNYANKELIILNLIKTTNDGEVYQKISDLLFELASIIFTFVIYLQNFMQIIYSIRIFL